MADKSVDLKKNKILTVELYAGEIALKLDIKYHMTKKEHDDLFFGADYASTLLIGISIQGAEDGYPARFIINTLKTIVEKMEDHLSSAPASHDNEQVRKIVLQ